MKAILVFSALALGIVSVQAQSYKHPYGLTQTSKIKSARVEQKQATEEQRRLTRRNYKNPQADQGDAQIVLLPASQVENVNNPLVADGNYKRQNRRIERTVAKREEENTIVQDTAKPANYNRKD